MGQCPDCGQKYNAEEVQICPLCRQPLWPMSEKLDIVQKKMGHAAFSHVFVDLVVYPNASFESAGTIHYRSAGCWCHPERNGTEGEWWLEHHNETRN